MDALGGFTLLDPSEVVFDLVEGYLVELEAAVVDLALIVTIEHRVRHNLVYVFLVVVGGELVPKVVGLYFLLLFLAGAIRHFIVYLLLNFLHVLFVLLQILFVQLVDVLDQLERRLVESGLGFRGKQLFLVQHRQLKLPFQLIILIFRDLPIEYELLLPLLRLLRLPHTMYCFPQLHVLLQPPAPLPRPLPSLALPEPLLKLPGHLLLLLNFY